ncbi:hypothetical protein ASD35_25280 [Pelomonas sp. Root1444]|nr:hypothetical protein ASD35_25280 [Pelomonas sp. Root1444]
MSLFAAAAAHAAVETFTYEVELHATSIGPGETVFGLSSPPATPFTGKLSFTADLDSRTEWFPGSFLVAATFQQLDITIGSASWTLAGSQYAHLITDSAGKQLAFDFRLFTEPNYQGFSLDILKGGPMNLDWSASTGGSCGFGQAGLVTDGPCIAGAVGTAQLTAVVPEPSQLRLLATALAAAAALRGIRRWKRARGGNSGQGRQHIDVAVAALPPHIPRCRRSGFMPIRSPLQL